MTFKKTKKVRYVEKQKGDIKITHSNTEKAQRLLNFQPNVNINEGLKIQHE